MAEPRPPQLLTGHDSALNPVTGLQHQAYLQLAPLAVFLHALSLNLITDLYCCVYACEETTATEVYTDSQDP